MSEFSSSNQDNAPGNRSGNPATPSESDLPTGFLHEQSWAERNGFPLWLMAFVWLVISFLLFQLVGTGATVVYLLVSGEDLLAFDADMLLEHLDILFIANSLSQILFLGLATWLVAGLLTTGKRSVFLRLQADARTLPVTFQTALLIVVMQPLVWLFSWLNAQIPFTDGYMNFEDNQIEMLKNFLTGDHIVLLTLIHVGLVPSICEEVLFRGYFQRAIEKSWGIWAAIIIGGLLFGIYHIRLTQVIPLALIGMLLAWIVWKSGSLYPAMAGHFVNNGGSVILASLYPEYMMDQMTTAEFPPVWLLLISLGATIMLIRAIHHTTKRE
jgi:uncharacterized protein